MGMWESRLVKSLTLNDGNEIPPIGFGTWKIVPNGRAKKAVAQAIEEGYRLIDTARIYVNERGVGKAIHESGIPREELFVTTKLWNGDHGYDKAHQALQKSLKRLQLSQVDLYLIHWPVTKQRLESWDALVDMRQQGLTRSIGVSNFTERHLKELFAHSDVRPAINQIEFHPLLYEEQKGTLELCKQEGIIVEAYSPLASGGMFQDSKVLGEIAKRHSKTNAQVVLRWSVQHGTIPIPRSQSREHVQENLDIFDFELTQDEMEAINGLSNGTRTCWDPNSME